MSNAKAKVFWTGRSQAVRLPKEFRFDSDEVSIRREGNSVILELPKVEVDSNDEWAWLDTLQPFDPDVVAAIEENEGPFEERPERDDFFK